MPKVISRLPAWLSRSTPAHRLFSVESPDNSEAYQHYRGKLENPGPRILAHRDSEVFTANGNTIRWADLASMKDNWESKHKKTRSLGESADLDDPQYRVRSCY